MKRSIRRRRTGRPGRDGQRFANLAKLKDRFTAETAAKTGKSERAVQRDATRADRLGADLDRIAGTTLDKGAELDALAAMPAPARQAIIERAAGGENVSALRPPANQRSSVLRRHCQPATPNMTTDQK